MSRVITFSRTYPSYHPKAGQPTYFVEKVMNSFHVDALGARFFIPFEEHLYDLNKDRIPYHVYMEFRDSLFNGRTEKFTPKYHTIRAGHRFKVGDKFSPRVWSGKPYRSKMIQFAPDIEVKKVFDFGMRMRCPYKEFYSGNCDLTGNSIVRVAMNDGLTSDDLYWWFQKPFDGQIICWNENVNY